MKVFEAIFLLIFVSSFSYPQEKKGNGNFPSGSISGRVFDASTNHSIEYANIVVFSQADSSMVTGGVTDSNGEFEISIQRAGRFYVEVRFIGYDTQTFETQINPENLSVDLGNILIHPTSVALENVVVQGDRSPVTYQIDKKVINPDQIQTVISGNASDVLANVPSVQIDIEGNVSLRGSQSFTVLIDGRPSVLNTQDALQQIAASSIERIEIITNPSAKYDPEGTAGIINIILKKGSSEGLNGIINANAGMNESYGGDFLFNYQSSKIRTNIGFDYNKRFFPGGLEQSNIQYFQSNTSTVNSTGDIERGRTNYGGRGGIEFLFGASEILSFGGRVGKREGQHFTNQDYLHTSSIEPADSSYTGTSERNREGVYYSLNSNYSHSFNTDGHQLLAELFFSSQESDELTTTSEFNQAIQISGKETTETGPSTDLRGKLDYTLPFNEFRKFEAGYQGEIDLSDETNELFEFNPLNGEYEFQSQYSNVNEYTESEHALYSLYADMIWDLQVQAGLRAEYTYRDINVPTQSQSFNLNRIDYFPSLHTAYKFNSLSTVMVSYSRRIERPSGWSLEPFDTWMDANNVRRGNPDLQPEFIDSYEAGIQSALGEVSVSAEVYYRITHDKIEEVRSAVDENVTLTTFENVGEDYSLGAEMMLIFNPLKFWNVNLMGNLFNYRIEGVLYDEPFSNESFSWQSRFNNIFKLWSSTQVQFNINYNSPRVTAQGRWEGSINSDLSIRHEFIQNVLAATLQVRDLFGTRTREFTAEGINFSNYNKYTFDSPILMLNIRYTFNNYKQKRERDGEEGEFEGGEDF